MSFDKYYKHHRQSCYRKNIRDYKIWIFGSEQDKREWLNEEHNITKFGAD